MLGTRKVCSVFTSFALLFQILFQPLAGNAQTSKKSQVLVCVPKVLVDNESWTYPYPGSEIDDCKKLLGNYILSHGNPQMQYRIKEDAFETFKRARRASTPYTPDPRNLLEEVSVERLGAKDVPRKTLSGPERESRLGLDFTLNKLKFRAYFFVDEVVGLDLVELVCQDLDYLTLADFNRLEADLTAKYDPPRNRKVDTKYGLDASANWTVGSTSIVLEMLDIKGRAGDKVIHTKSLDITYQQVGVDKL